MKILSLLLTLTILPNLISENVAPIQSEDIRSGTLLKRKKVEGQDNYPFATYSFEFGGNGTEMRQQCRNDWDLLFGNSPLSDAFDVTMVTDDRSRIRDLGKLNWTDNFKTPRLPAYEEPEHEPSVKAIEGHIYIVHTRDTDTDLYALFRVEKLTTGEKVEITWKLISPPKKRF
jgi:hypothetical protein